MNRSSLLHLQALVVGYLGALLLRALSWTLRWETVGLDGEQRYWPHHKPRIIAFWHSQLLMMPWIYRRGVRGRDARPIFALVSQHQDGRLIASTLQRLGISSVGGSSSNNGREAIYALTEKIKQGGHVAITPDGPKGPPEKLKAGVIRIAERGGAPISPIAFAAERAWTFNSWDRMQLPKPFSRVVLVMGDEISIPQNLRGPQVQQYADIVERGILAASHRARTHWQR